MTDTATVWFEYKGHRSEVSALILRPHNSLPTAGAFYSIIGKIKFFDQALPLSTVEVEAGTSTL